MAESPVAWGILLIIGIVIAVQMFKAFLRREEMRAEALERAHEEWEAEFQ